MNLNKAMFGLLLFQVVLFGCLVLELNRRNDAHDASQVAECVDAAFQVELQRVNMEVLRVETKRMEAEARRSFKECALHVVPQPENVQEWWEP